MNPMALIGLIPTLRKVGVPLLEMAIGSRNAETATGALDVIGRALGVPATPEDVRHSIEADPAKAEAALARVEADPEMREWLVARIELDRRALDYQQHMAGLDREGGWFSWAWRPAGMWLNLALWAGNAVTLIVINGLLGVAAPIVPWGDLIWFTAIYAGFYMGGHTIKEAVKTWKGAR